MQIWKRRGDYSSLEEYFESNGLSPQELLTPPQAKPESIENMEKAAALIRGYLASGRQDVVIIGDYDADGITATAILVKMFRHFGIEPTTIIPKRFTDGYGISATMIGGIKDSLIITVDNGITALPAIRAAKDAGNTIVILDHHLPGSELPEADVIVDPHIAPERNGFVDYCGAGLAFKLAELMCQPRSDKTSQLFADITVLAAIGTIADVMPMVGDNRHIIREGLNILNGVDFDLVSAGVRGILLLAGGAWDEDTIKFKVGPLLNAPGRLYNAGSTSTLKAVLCTDPVLAHDYAGRIYELNERRKDLSAQWLGYASERAQEQADGNIRVLLCPGMPEGLTGLVAAKIAESFQCVTFVFTRSKDNPGILKGSGRTYGSVDISALLPVIRDVVVSAGGHTGAAGVSVLADRFEEMSSLMRDYMSRQGDITCDDTLYYDMVVSCDSAKQMLKDVRKYAPYGEGVPKPVFMVSGFECCDNKFTGMHYRTLGADASHVKLFGDKMDAIGFNLAGEYEAIGYPRCVDLLGDIGENTYNGYTSLQFEVMSVQPHS